MCRKRLTVRKIFIAENISDEADYRKRIRDLTFKKGTLVSVAKDEKAESVYEMYYDFEEPVSKACRTPCACTEPWRERKIPEC